MDSLKPIIILAAGLGLGSYVTQRLLSIKPKLKSFALKDQLVRNGQFFKEGQKKIEDSFVVIIGLGSVGSHVAVTLARSGVRKLRIVDNSVLTPGALNGHGVAKANDVGKYKTEVVKEHLSKIIPQCEVETYRVYYNNQNADFILSGTPDFVVDCVGDISAKADLIDYCLRKKIQIVTTSSVGGKIDPTRLEVSDISRTKNCDAIRQLRKTLKNRGIITGVPVVYLAETPRHLQLDKIWQAGSKQQPVPALGTLTSITGNSIASYVLSKLGGVEFDPFIRDEYRKHSFLKICKHLEDLEKRVFRADLEMDNEEIEQVARGL